MDSIQFFDSWGSLWEVCGADHPEAEAFGPQWTARRADPVASGLYPREGETPFSAARREGRVHPEGEWHILAARQTPEPNPAWNITVEDGSVYEERLSALFVKWQREYLDAGTLWYVLSSGGGEENFVAGNDEEAAQRAFSAWAGADDETGWEEIEVTKVVHITAIEAAYSEDAELNDPLGEAVIGATVPV
jgi:hypothetical protein